MKKLFFIVLPSLILAVGIYFLLQFVFFRNSEKGGLQVTATPKSRIFLDGKEIGQTPLCKCEPPDMIPIGTYDIRVVPLSGTSSEFTERVKISPAVLTVVDRKFADNGGSESSIITLTPLSDKKHAELLVSTTPEGVSIFLDDTNIGVSPYLLKNVTGDTDHTLVLKKDGYTDKTVNIHTPLGYQLSATIGLGINAGSVSPTPASTSAVLTPTSSPTPTSMGTVTILQTPNGFLRVRDTASAVGTEIARVTSGQSFPLLTESNGWYEIKMTDGTTGWVSSQYAEKR